MSRIISSGMYLNAPESHPFELSGGLIGEEEPIRYHLIWYRVLFNWCEGCSILSTVCSVLSRGCFISYEVVLCLEMVPLLLSFLVVDSRKLVEDCFLTYAAWIVQEFHFFLKD
jgi:hypothetical protein